MKPLLPILLTLSLLCGCARPDIRSRLNRKTMMVQHSYLVEVHDLPKALLMVDPRERVKWFFDHAEQVKKMVMVDVEDMQWILDNW